VREVTLVQCGACARQHRKKKSFGGEEKHSSAPEGRKREWPVQCSFKGGFEAERAASDADARINE
jgi:hypothetical protein